MNIRLPFPVQFFSKIKNLSERGLAGAMNVLKNVLFEPDSSEECSIQNILFSPDYSFFDVFLWNLLKLFFRQFSVTINRVYFIFFIFVLERKIQILLFLRFIFTSCSRLYQQNTKMKKTKKKSKKKIKKLTTRKKSKKSEYEIILHRKWQTDIHFVFFAKNSNEI